MSDGREPVALAMILCDAVHRDFGTGKCTILGTFSVLFAPGFPVTHPMMTVYVCLTECCGKVPFLIQIVDVDEEREPVARLDGEIEAGDPIMVAEVVIALGTLSFPAAGEYRVQLFSGGHPIIERRLLVLPTSPRPSPPDPPEGDAHD